MREFKKAYIGLKDMDGKKLFEGDWVKIFKDRTDFCEAMEKDNFELWGIEGQIIYIPPKFMIDLDEHEDELTDIDSLVFHNKEGQVSLIKIKRPRTKTIKKGKNS